MIDEELMELEKQIKDILAFYKADNIFDVIKPLFHYTSLDSLALILSTKKLKLNCLKYVDDKSEALTIDIGDFRKYCFASCWTDLENESIPFWKMYTNDMKGVRISLPKYPFDIHKITYQPKYLVMDYGVSYLDEKYVVNNDYLVIPNNSILEKIIYTDSEEELMPSVYKETSDHSYQYAYGRIGKYKSKQWEFQSEYRYFVLVIPGGGILKLDCMEYQNHPFLRNAIINKVDVPIDCIYLDIKQEALDSMEITIGPKMSEGDKVLLKCHIEKYCPKATISESCLIGKV